MADAVVHGVAVGIRDVPQRGMIVRLAAPAVQGLEPAEAAELGQAIIALADEAMLAEQAKRRSTR